MKQYNIYMTLITHILIVFKKQAIVGKFNKRSTEDLKEKTAL